MRNKKQEKSQLYREELLSVIIQAAKDKHLLDEFLKDLLTKNENHEIPVRWQIVQHLSRGESYGSISRMFGVGISTVTRGARELVNKQGGFWKLLRKKN